MTEEKNEITSAYRSARRNTSVLAGIGIAWAAAQLEIKTLSLGSVGDVNLERASIPILIGILSLYAMLRCTIEYMMQPNAIRRWPLAKTDYLITLNLVRFSLVALAASTAARTGEMVIYISGAFLSALVGFFILTFALMFIVMPFLMFIRSLTGRTSVANAAIEAMFYPLLISGLIYITLLLLIGFNIFQPFHYLDESYQNLTNSQIFVFSSVCLLVLISFFLETKFLNIIFLFEPIMIEKTHYENGEEIFSIEPNPNHPNYEKIKNERHSLKLKKVNVDKT